MYGINDKQRGQGDLMCVFVCARSKCHHVKWVRERAGDSCSLRPHLVHVKIGVRRETKMRETKTLYRSFWRTTCA